MTTPSKTRRSLLKWIALATLISLIVIVAVSMFLQLSYQHNSDGTGVHIFARNASLVVFYDSDSRLAPGFFTFKHAPAMPQFVPNMVTVQGQFEMIVPLWIPIAILGLMTVWLFRRDPKPTPGQCQQCGYNLNANESGRCPECGNAVPANHD